jgi:hypothetical protein
MGDSNSTITAGNPSYPTILSRALSGWTAENASTAGATSTIGVAKITGLSDEQRDVDVMHAMYGTVDVSPGGPFHPYIITKTHYLGNLVSMIQRFPQRTKFVFSAPQIPPIQNAFQRLFLFWYAEVISDMEKMFPNKVFMGAGSNTVGPEQFIPGNAHYLQSGHELLADAILPRILQLVPFTSRSIGKRLLSPRYRGNFG